MVKRAVNMRRHDWNEARRAEQAGAFDDDTHRHACAISVRAGGDGALPVAERQAHASSFRMVSEVARA